jgi:hypothetical protein
VLDADGGESSGSGDGSELTSGGGSGSGELAISSQQLAVAIQR